MMFILIGFKLLVLCLHLCSSWKIEDLVDEILVQRPPGSEGSRHVAQFIEDFYAYQLDDWSFEKDSFEQETVLGRRKFTNLIARLNPQCPKFIVLACHYDSRDRPAQFLGATDSAVPCAIIMDIAQELIEQHDKGENCLGMTNIFFDGEEALVDFTETDGLYGSKHLAEKWAKSSMLEQIRLFILLDLVGATAPNFNTYSFDDTEERNPYYDHLMRIEQSYNFFINSSFSPMFAGKETWYPPTDDHTPFWQRGVNQILHLIPTPFPSTWHTIDDNKEHLDFEYIQHFCQIFKLFINSLLHNLE